MLKLRLRTLTFSVTNLLKICRDEKHSFKYLYGVYIWKSNNVGAESEKKIVIRADEKTSKQNQNMFQRTSLATAKAGGFNKANYQVGKPHF